MAITQETEIENVEVTRLHLTYPVIKITEKVCFDDPDDDKLPQISVRTRLLTMVFDENSPPSYVTPDVSGEEQIVQDIAGVIWP